MKIKQLLVLGVCSLLILNGCGLADKNIDEHSGNDVNIVIDDDKAKNNKDNNDDNNDAINIDNVDNMADDEDEVFLTSLPESITGRSIIIPGAEPTDHAWELFYQADCNIQMDSSEDEFVEFVEGLFGTCEIEKFDNKIFAHGRDIYPNILNNGIEDYPNFQMYKTSDGYADCEHGYWFIEDDPGYNENLYYDASGKYLLATNAGWLSEQSMIAFLEPEIVNVSVLDNDGNIQEEYTDDDDIQKIKDAFHEMDATWISKQNVTGDIKEAIDNGDRIIVLATNEYDVTSEYTFIDGKYLIKDNEVYSLSDVIELF